MELGLISPGNGEALATALRSLSIDETVNVLAQWVSAAKAQACNNILVSTEAIVHSFQDQDKLELLEQAAKKAGIKEIKALGFFRELCSHALSTYKHRAASGAYPDYQLWLNNHYETPIVLARFLSVHNQTEIQWTFRKFKKDSHHLITAFFNDWLQVDLPDLPAKESVNESLTLSEISLISVFAQQHSKLLTGRLSKNFRELAGNKKSPDDGLEQMFLHQAELTLKEYNPLIQQLNQYLKSAESLALITASKGSALLDTSSFTPAQLEVLAQTTSSLVSWQGVRQQLYQRLVACIPVKIRKKIIQQRYMDQIKAKT